MRHTTVATAIDDLDMDEINAAVRNQRGIHCCECGCGTEIPRYTKEGKPRRFCKGHHTRLKNPNTKPQLYTSAPIVFRLAPDQYTALLRAALKAGITPAQYARMQLLRRIAV